ncbi:hypothetical protein MAINES_00910 [Brevundimonas phage vB_BpoS-MaInes]|nr:hypothetical protein MAINES_00910 [Brevundimonas phage vB_BpoS-MaInes]
MVDEAQVTEGMEFEDGEGFSFNMKEEKATSGYPLIPVGTHDATIEAAEFKVSQNSGNPMWQVKWAVPVTELDKDENPVTKIRKVTSFVVFSAEQRGRAKQFVKRIAPELADLEDFNPRTLASQLVGKAGRVKINHQPGQDDEIRSNVADVLAPTGGASGGFAL